jgi:hypothetical protein
MRATKIAIGDVAEGNDYGRASVDSSITKVQVLQNVSSVPVYVALTRLPAKSVKVTLNPELAADNTNNPDKTISLSDDYLLFEPWDN